MSGGVAAAVECRALAVELGGETVLDGLDLEVAAGEMVAVLGPSGSGKSTLLGAVAGFLRPNSGVLRMAGRMVAGPAVMVPPEARSVGVVFQGFALWPHLTVLETVAYPARRRGLPVAAARAEALALIEQMGLGRLRDRRPGELSGGEQQRVGLARALARRPALFLFDEPTSQLDKPLRAGLQRELDDQRARLGAAAIFATHDFEEALALAGRVALLRSGRVVQAGSPRDVYESPVDPWSAALTGPASVLEGRVLGAGRVALGGVEVRLDLRSGATGVDPQSGARDRLLVRPDWARLGGPLPGVARRVLFRGAHTDYLLETPVGPVEVREIGAPRAAAGAATGWTLERAWLLPPQPASP